MSGRLVGGVIAAVLAAGGAGALSGHLPHSSAPVTALTCGADQVHVTVPKTGDGAPLPVVMAAAAPTIPLKRVMDLNAMTPTTILLNPAGELCITIKTAKEADKQAPKA